VIYEYVELIYARLEKINSLRILRVILHRNTIRMSTIVKQPTLSYKFYGLSREEEVQIQELVHKNIMSKADAYLKSIFTQSKDAEVLIDYKIQKNKQNRYESSFRFAYEGKIFVYKNKTAFKFVQDLVNHAFEHFTRELEKQSRLKNTKHTAKEA